MTKALFTSLLLIAGQTVFGQNVSNKGRFSVDYIAGCAPLTVSLTDLGTVTDIGTPILVHFNRDPNDPESLAGIQNPISTGGTIDTTYTTPGTYLIGQVNGNVADPTDRFDFITVVVTESVAPSFTVSTCTNNNVIVDIDFNAVGDTYDGYQIDFGDGTITNITKSDPNTVNHTYAAQNNYTITVTGQLDNGLSTACGMASMPITTIQNLPLPTITELVVQSSSSALFTYTTLESTIGYELQVDDGSGFRTLTALSAATDPTSFTLDDNSFNFETSTYTFRVSATEACGNSTGFSNELPTIALTHSAAYNGTAIDVVFDWLTSSNNLTELFLLQDGNIIGMTSNVTGQQIISLNNCNTPLTFQIEGNFMGNVSRSLLRNPDLSGILTPPAPLEPEILFSGGSLLVRWPASSVNASQYNIYRQDEDGTYVQVGNTGATQYADNALPTLRQVCYRISYVDDCGNESELSVEVCENLSNIILIPNAFTPNGDGLNDIFRVADGVYRNFEMYIYNRWGGLVFVTTTPSNGWDGNFNGKLSPPGSYIYRVRYFDTDDRLTTLSGTFLLIR